jgi:hypothetical protein
VRATIAVDGADVRVDYWREPDCNTLRVVAGSTNPKSIATLSDRFRRAAAAREIGWDLKMRIRVKHDAWADYLSWLRAAYLVAFAAFGYRYIARPALEIVREQIKRPKERMLPYMTGTDHSAAPTARKLLVGLEPADLACIAVQFGDRMLFLPSLADDEDFYPRLVAAGHKRPGQITVHGPEVRWPTEPVLALDFDPSLIRRLTPAAAGSDTPTTH